MTKFQEREEWLSICILYHFFKVRLTKMGEIYHHRRQEHADLNPLSAIPIYSLQANVCLELFGHET